jgi:predicted GNAT superfamily acetyltransferase
MDDVLIRPARERGDYEACVELQREVWGLADLEITSTIQLVATVHAGGLLLVADSGSRGVVGFCYAFAALGGGEPHLHSDMLAVREPARGQGLGLRLKWAQREEALRRGLRLVTWTFDPMRAANARLNLHHLGAVAREVLPDFYGTTSSALHHGLATDRLLARWELGAPRVLDRLEGERRAPSLPATAPVLNDVAWRGGRPVPAPPRLDTDAKELLLEVPGDWDAVCRADARLAREWQDVVRRSFEAAFARGYAAVDCFSEGEGERRRALYLLRQSDGRDPA